MFSPGFAFSIFILLQLSVFANTVDDGSDSCRRQTGNTHENGAGTEASCWSINKSVKPVFLSHNCIHRYAEGKSHDGIPILLLHGLTSSQTIWKGVDEVLALETGSQVCSVDLRNHGTSPWNNRTDVEAMTDDIAQLLEILNIGKAIIVGASMGGKVAVHTALRYPEKVEKIFVEDMRPNGIIPDARLMIKSGMAMFSDSLTAIPKSANESTAKEALLKFVNDKVEQIFPDSKIRFTLDFLSPITLRNGAWDWQANMRFLSQAFEDFEEFWTESAGRFDGPAVFLYGTQSEFKVGEDESNIRKLFPNAQLVPLKGIGHGVRFHPDYMKELLNFIALD